MNFKVYKSSAGSGKTYTLVKFYLRLCLQSSSAFYFTKILAITFTNKAASEMKDRILKALKDIASESRLTGTSSFLKIELMEELKIGETEIKDKCQKMLQAILHNYSDFNVSTIDKFSHKLIRTFAKDLGLSMNFKVDLNEVELLKRAIDKLYDAVGQNDYITKLLVEESLNRIDDSKSWDLDNDLENNAKIILSDEGLSNLQGIKNLDAQQFLHIKKDLKKRNTEIERELRSLSDEFFRILKQDNISEASIAGGSGAIVSFFSKLRKEIGANVLPTATVQNNLEGDKWFSAKATAADKEMISANIEKFRQLYEAAILIMEAELKDYLGRKLILRNISAMALLKEIESQFTKLKKGEGVLGISDFNKKIAEVVINEPMPFIYERLGEKFNHIMIDEFQDTSVLQFMNLLPLIEESLSRGKENLIVGDAKQAIYRFRGGEVEQFSLMPNYRPKKFDSNDIVSFRLDTLSSQYKEFSLKTNYRSKPQLVKFNNEFFDFLNGVLPEQYGLNYQNHQQLSLGSEDLGYVNIKFHAKDDAEEDKLNQVFDDVIFSRSNGYSFKDIAVLVKKNKEASKIAEFLKGKGLPVISSDSLLLMESKEVLFLIEVAKFVFQENDPIAIKCMLEYLQLERNLPGELSEIHLKYIHDSKAFDKLLQSEGYSLNRLFLKTLTTYDLFEHLIRLFKLNVEFDVYLQFLQEATYEFNLLQSTNFEDFMLWWEGNKTKLSLDVPEGMDAIQIMSVHKSKGLEFPVVIFPFAGESKSNTNFIWVDSSEYLGSEFPKSLVKVSKGYMVDGNYEGDYEAEAEKNLLDLVNETYVAFTRASDCLFVRLDKIKSETSSNLSSFLSTFLADRLNENNSIEIGKISTVQSDNQGLDSPEILNYISAPWRERILLSKEASRNFMNEQIDSNARVFGLVFHEVMEGINEKEDIQAAINKQVLLGSINKEQATILSAEIMALLSMDIVKDCFGPEIKAMNERSLMHPSGQVLRPDRVVFLPEKYIVLDYKTGEKNEQHQEQVLKYVSILNEMTKLPIEAFLIYLDGRDLVKVA